MCEIVRVRSMADRLAGLCPVFLDEFSCRDGTPAARAGHCAVAPAALETQAAVSRWQGSGIAVGTMIAHRPPHRSVLAEFPHTALTLSV